MRTALLVAAENRPEDAREALLGLRPMPDYVALADALDARLLDCRESRRVLHPTVHAVARRAGPDAVQAVLGASLRGEFDAFLCNSEAIALALAALLRVTRARHPIFFIGHRMSTRRKQALWRALCLCDQMAGAFCYAETQAKALRHLGLSAERLHPLPFHADHRFFQPAPFPGERLVVSVGLEHRDYATLAAAARHLDCPVHIVAGSPWSCSRPLRETLRGAPGNVRFLPRLSYVELRDLYARAAVVAVPVQPVDFQAGITSLLEAMAMGCPVVATANPGLRETFAQGDAGLWGPPGDAGAMATALAYVLDHPREAAEMGRRGRLLIENRLTLDHWVARIAGVVKQQPVSSE